MSPTAGFVITPLRPEQASDFLRFFDHECGVAFATIANGECYAITNRCQVDPGLAIRAQNSTAMQARIEVGEMGRLSRSKRRVVGG